MCGKVSNVGLYTYVKKTNQLLWLSIVLHVMAIFLIISKKLEVLCRLFSDESTKFGKQLIEFPYELNVKQQ